MLKLTNHLRDAGQHYLRLVKFTLENILNLPVRNFRVRKISLYKHLIKLILCHNL